MRGSTVSWFGSEVTGGSETVWTWFERYFGLKPINYARVKNAMSLSHSYGQLGFPEIDSAAYIEEYVAKRQLFVNDDVMIKNSMQLPTFKPRAHTFCLVQDCHKYGVERLDTYYDMANRLRIGKTFDMYQRISVDNADTAVYVSNFAKAKFDQEHENDCVIEHGIDLDEFKPGDKDAARLLFNINTEKPVGLWVGRMHPQKGAHIMAELIKDESIHWVLCFMGQAPKSVDGDVTVLSNVARFHMPMVYNAADFFILPAYCETFGLASLEAAACGLPIVSNETGWLWKRDNSKVGPVLEERDNEVESYRAAIKDALAKTYDPRSVAQYYSVDRWKEEWGRMLRSVCDE